MKLSFLKLGSIITISPRGPKLTFQRDDSKRDLLRFNKTTIYEEFNLSPSPFGVLSFDKLLLERKIAQGMISRGKRSGMLHSFTMDLELGYKYIGKFCGGVQWYMLESRDNISSIQFKLKNETKQLVSFNGQSKLF